MSNTMRHVYILQLGHVRAGDPWLGTWPGPESPNCPSAARGKVTFSLYVRVHYNVDAAVSRARNLEWRVQFKSSIASLQGDERDRQDLQHAEH